MAHQIGSLGKHWNKRFAPVLLCYCENIFSDEEYFILCDLCRPKNLDLPYEEHPFFDLESMLNDECKTEFRFEKSQLPLFVYKFHLCSSVHKRV